jgi:hypothetical protein
MWLFGLLLAVFTIVGGILVGVGMQRKRPVVWITVGALLVIIALYELIDRFPQTGDALVAIATIGLVIFAALQINENRLLREQEEKLRERERKERLLDKIVEWASDINTASLNKLAPSDLTPKGMLAYRTNTMLRYGQTLSKSVYIKSIAVKYFNTELADHIDNVLDATVVFMFVEGHLLGMDDLDDAFEGKYSDIINQVKTGKKESDRDQCARNLANALDALLAKTGEMSLVDFKRV